MLPKRLTLCFLLLTASIQARAETIAIINVNVIPMTADMVLPAKTVIISDGRIERIGPVAEVPIPEQVFVIDGTDRYLMPGLAEMHGHIPDVNSKELRRVLDLYVANGITLTRGMLGKPDHLRLRQQILDGEVLGPRLLTSGPSFNERSVSSETQAALMVRDQVAAGYDFLKIHPGLNRKQFDAVANTARELGIPFAGHVPEDVGLRHALELGIATVDHLDGYMQVLIKTHDDPTGGFEGFFGLLLAEQADPSKIDAIVNETLLSGTWNVPTQSLFENVVSSTDSDEMVDWPEMRFMPLATVEQWRDAKLNVINDPSYRTETALRAITIRRQLIKALHDAGAGLLLGSDSPQIFNVPGFSIHRELQLLVDAGLTPFEALQTGTTNPARFFGHENDWGTVEEGRVADLVLLNDNPLADISASRRVHGVMLGGRWLSRERIRELLDTHKR